MSNSTKYVGLDVSKSTLLAVSQARHMVCRETLKYGKIRAPVKKSIRQTLI